MQYTLSLAALAATASASFAVRSEAKIFGEALPGYGVAKVVNRCPYDVYLWSINKQLGCNSDAAKKLKKGESYAEYFKDPKNSDDGGISIKISKWDQCGGKDQTQLEYKIVRPDNPNKAAPGNYLDMSFVNCQGGDCPGWNDGFYMGSGKSGAKDIVQASAVDNEHCPEFMVSNSAEAAKVSYVDPHDRQTKFCKTSANLDLYLCGSQRPDASDDAAPAPSSSKASSVAAPSQPKPSTLQVLPSKPASPDNDVKAKAAEVTPAPQAPAAEGPKVVKTVVKYVTVDAPMPKRHAHGRRHNHL